MKMRIQLFHIFLVLTLITSPISINANTCEESETSHVKLDLAKQSIISAKSLYPKCEDEKTDSNCSAKDRSLAHLNAALDLISEAKPLCRPCLESKVVDPTKPDIIEPIEPEVKATPMDCSEILAQGFNKSGVYQIWPRILGDISNKSIDVYCDMETDRGGWTMIQRRGNFSAHPDFNQNWDTYKKGFGDIKGEFWLGNDNIYYLTNQGQYSVRFDLIDSYGVHKYAVYNTFFTGNEASGYLLRIKGHSGTATDDMSIHDSGTFSTMGHENNYDCISRFTRSPFWHTNGCGYVNLNGFYQPRVNDMKGIWWFQWKGTYECLHYVDMKIRRNSI